MIAGQYLVAVVFLVSIGCTICDNSERLEKKFHQWEKNLTIAIGQQLKLVCHTNDSSGDWRFASKNKLDRAIIVSGEIADEFKTRLQLFTLPQKSTIIMRNITFNDTGRYTCFLDDEFSDREITTVSVTYYKSVNFGDRLELRCFSNNPWIEWKYQVDEKDYYQNVTYSGVISHHFTSKQFTVGHESEHHDLVEHSLSKQRAETADSGFYTCHNPPENNFKHTVLLIVAVHVALGGNVTLPCKSLKGGVKWTYCRYFSSLGEKIIYINNETVNGFHQSGRFSVLDCSLLITNANVSDSGLYAWIENDGFGSKHFVELLVHEKPTNSMDDPGMSGTQLGLIIIGCVVPAVAILVCSIVVCILYKKRKLCFSKCPEGRCCRNENSNKERSKEHEGGQSSPILDKQSTSNVLQERYDNLATKLGNRNNSDIIFDNKNYSKYAGKKM